MCWASDFEVTLTSGVASNGGKTVHRFDNTDVSADIGKLGFHTTVRSLVKAVRSAKKVVVCCRVF